MWDLLLLRPVCVTGTDRTIIITVRRKAAREYKIRLKREFDTLFLKMCQIVSEEIYSRCGHKFPCHLKYPLLYCAIPDGVPYPQGTVMDEDFQPIRFCKEEDWIDTVIVQDGNCPNCVHDEEERDIAISFEKGHSFGKLYIYDCGHKRPLVWHGALQECFSARGSWDSGDGRLNASILGKCSFFFFSFPFFPSLMEASRL